MSVASAETTSAGIASRTGELVCSQVAKYWDHGGPDEMHAVDHVDLTVKPGEIVVILGPSGCGKSTLLSMIAGLVQSSSGSITIDGRPVTGPGPDRGMVFQQASLYPWLTVAQNVAFGLRLKGVPRKEREQRAREILQRMELGGFGDKRPAQLSGGMLQRAAIARSLAMDPEILLMDEPFAALDPQTRSRMQRYISQIRRDSGVSVIFVTHSIDEAVAIADRIVVFTARPGRIKAVVDVDLPGGRDPRAPETHALTDRLYDLISGEVDAAFSEQEGA
jgi:NitT/TauT family transport system ATP-binding protein